MNDPFIQNALFVFGGVVLFGLAFMWLLATSTIAGEDEDKASGVSAE